MKRHTRVLLGLFLGVATLTGFHLALNVDWDAMLNDTRPESVRKLTVAYVPVT